ncbi:hypothetical protein [Paraflavitalea speifideaquila]|uniref:hypothetical protein n=1 Tax=Paraflavitalea speifideaquila TaxID=3076558 RepID=UPI0028E2FFEC|nr:hypothetical protein [Paraflavitalea speifideiaquila]
MYSKDFWRRKKANADTTLIIDEAKEPDMQDLASIFDVVVKNGFISKKTNSLKYKALLSRPEMEQAKR